MDAPLSIVVGAHIEAEITDRPLAYTLRQRLEDRIGVAPLVCSDLWYVNEKQLRLRPAITLGRPEINAATAFLAQRVPTAMLVEGRFRLQLDPELVELDACLWGPDGAGTAAAVEAFTDRWLDEYAERLGVASARGHEG